MDSARAPLAFVLGSWFARFGVEQLSHEVHLNASSGRNHKDLNQGPSHHIDVVVGDKIEVSRLTGPEIKNKLIEKTSLNVPLC